MKKIKKRVIATIAIIILTMILANNSNKVKGISIDNSSKTLVKIGVFAKDLTDDYLIFLRQNFENIQEKNPGKVIFTFYDAKFNQATQDTDIENSINFQLSNKRE